MNAKGKANDIGNARTNVIESTRPAKGTSRIPLIQPFAVSPTKTKNNKSRKFLRLPLTTSASPAGAVAALLTSAFHSFINPIHLPRALPASLN